MCIKRSENTRTLFKKKSFNGSMKIYITNDEQTHT